MKKIKRLPFHEQVLLYNILIFIFVSILSLIASNTNKTFEVFGMVNKFMISLLFKGQVLKVIIFIILFLLLIVFIGYWITNSIIQKHIVLGPYYLLLFIFVLLFSEGYYVIVNHIDIYYVTLVFLTIVSLISTIISFVNYLKLINKEEIENNG